MCFSTGYSPLQGIYFVFIFMFPIDFFYFSLSPVLRSYVELLGCYVIRLLWSYYVLGGRGQSPLRVLELAGGPGGGLAPRCRPGGRRRWNLVDSLVRHWCRTD